MKLKIRLEKLESDADDDGERKYTWAEIIQSVDNPDILNAAPTLPYCRGALTLSEWNSALVSCFESDA